VPLEHFHAQHRQIPERVRQTHLALGVGDRFFAPECQVEVAAVVAGHQHHMLVRQRLAVLSVGHAHGDGLIVDHGKDLVSRKHRDGPQ
jgi:hypothetical protein